MTKHPIVHFEIHGTDRHGLAAFYADTLGWETRDADGMDYTFVTIGEETPTGGGLADADEHFRGSMIYIQCPDIDATVDLAVSNGAEVIQPVETIPGTVTMAVLKDPQGNRFGLVAETVHDS